MKLYDPLGYLIFPCWTIPRKKKQKERKGKQTRGKWFAKCYLKAETLLNDESQRIPTTSLLVKNQHGVQRQIQENLSIVDSVVIT